MFSSGKIGLIVLAPFFFINAFSFNPFSYGYITSGSFNYNTIKLSNVASLQLKSDEIKRLKKSAVWKHLIQEGAKVKAKAGFKIFNGKLPGGGNLTVVTKDQKDDKSTVDLTPNFQIIWENLSYILYCSCGSNVMGGVGDECFAYQTSQGPRCGGNCSEGFGGQTCNFTLLNLSNGQTTNMF